MISSWLFSVHCSAWEHAFWSVDHSAVAQILCGKVLAGIVDMLALSVQSGDSLSMAVEKTAAKVHGPPKRELSLCARQLQLGLPISQAMNELCSAFSLFELNLGKRYSFASPIGRKPCAFASQISDDSSRSFSISQTNCLGARCGYYGGTNHRFRWPTVDHLLRFSNRSLSAA